MQTWIPRGPTYKGHKKGRFEEFGPDAKSSVPQIKEESQNIRKIMFLFLYVHMVVCGQKQAYKKVSEFAKIHKRHHHHPISPPSQALLQILIF